MNRTFLAKQGAGFIFLILLFLLPIQIGKHFWPTFSFVGGIRIDYLSPTLYITDVLILFLFVLNIPKLFQNLKSKKLPITNYQLPIVFLLGLFIGVIRSENSSAGWYGLLKLSEMIFFGWLVFNFFKTKHNEKVVNTIFCLGVLAESVIGIWQFFAQKSIGGVFYFLGERTFSGQTPGIANASLAGNLVLRPYATFPHPNVHAGYLLILMTYVLFYLPKKNKLFFVATLLLGSIALLLTLSRVTIVLWSAVLLFQLFRLGKKRIAVVFLIVYLLLFFLTPLSKRFSLSMQDEAIVSREKLVSYSVVIAKKSPFFGVGINNFYNALSHVQTQSKETLPYLQPVHNIYLFVLSETGILGFLFFLYFLKSAFIHCKKAFLQNPAFLLLSLVLLLGLFDHYFLTLQQGQLLFALVLGMAFAI